MKLQYQLNIAFTTLLLVIMAVTGFVIYSLILDLLIQDEKAELEQKGEILVQILNQESRQPSVDQFSGFLQDQNLHLILYDRIQNAVLDSTIPRQIVNGFLSDNDFSDFDKELWGLGDNKYVTSRILFYPESTGLELILLTPLNDLQKVQHDFITKLLIVFLIGAIAAVILSYFFTNKLVTPLTRLKWQLKKVEKRRFDEIEPIKATGEIKEVEKSVFEMADELQRYMKSQQTFFQNASHELKTPLMTIQGYAEGIRDGIFDQEEKEKGLEVMVTEVSRLKKIINEMILLAKLDSEQTSYEPEKMYVKNSVDQVMERALPITSEKGIQISQHVDDDLFIYADPEKLLRALLNITVNGIRHAKSQVRIDVKQINRMITISIEDDGEGIDKDLIPQIFHRFIKGKQGETGLGLAIARAIVEQSGGNITVGSSDLGGAKFVIAFNMK
ncbi:two-component sensor histidine kinase [Virgibacillus phasianinus]|uniref:histidine kinase n=1 Tax=Virgibacillus phasianinus TaxID=2017483 RepID=A0A220TZM5_9BACI|nr:HAMP domain-containing sensor histidine kinase [Virgibacillus phasianinus]ASK61288.1 two-component sensor histidine kinase [Virgibacillus phasianinus]